MFSRREAYSAAAWGVRAGELITKSNLANLTTRGGLLRGAIRQLTFSTDGTLLFIGRADGVLEARSTGDGGLLSTWRLFVGCFVALQWVGEALWAMGEDERVLVLGAA